MIAVYYMPVTSPMFVGAGVALTLGGIALIVAQMSRAEAKRLILAALIAIGLACAVVNAGDNDIVVRDPMQAFCETLEPYGWWWYFFDCGQFGGK